MSYTDALSRISQIQTQIAALRGDPPPARAVPTQAAPGATSAGQSPETQIAALQRSGWASSGDSDLPTLYRQVAG